MVTKVKGTVLIRNIQDNTWGLLSIRRDKKNVLVRFLSAGLDKNIKDGTAVSAVIIKEHCLGLNLDVAVNVNKTKGPKSKNVAMLKGSGKKQGAILSVNPADQMSIIGSTTGTNYVAYSVSFLPVGTSVTFKDSGQTDPSNNLLIAIDVKAS